MLNDSATEKQETDGQQIHGLRLSGTRRCTGNAVLFVLLADDLALESNHNDGVRPQPRALVVRSAIADGNPHAAVLSDVSDRGDHLIPLGFKRQ